MKKPHFLCMADAHVGHLFRSQDPKCEGWSEDVFLATLREMLAAVDDPKLTALLIAGDLAEAAEINGGTLDALSTARLYLKDAGVKCFYIDGNHDRQARNRMSLAAELGGVLLSTKPINFSNMTLCGVSSTSAAQLTTSLDEIRANGGCDILLLHQASQHLFRFESGGSYDVMGIGLDVCRQMILVGDIHLQDVSSTNVDGHVRYVVSPGSLVPRNVTERSCGYVTWTPGEKPLLQSRNRINLVDVELPADDLQAVHTAKAAIAAPPSAGELYRVVNLHAGSKQLSLARKLADAEDIPPETMVLVSALQSELDSEAEQAREILSGPVRVGSLRDKLRYVIHPDREWQAFQLAAAILDAPDPASAQTVVDSFVKDYLDGKIVETPVTTVATDAPALPCVPPPPPPVTEETNATGKDDIL